MAMLLAVADRRLELPVLHRDVYASAVGGVKLGEPGSDLALALAIISSAYEKAIPVDLIAVGEVGLAGEIRPVPAVPQRLAAAHRLGFRRALVPPGGGPAPDGMRVQEVTNLAQATHWATSGAMLSPSQETRRIRSVR
jgi:DNA repair protein RadA/Sms